MTCMASVCHAVDVGGVLPIPSVCVGQYCQFQEFGRAQTGDSEHNLKYKPNRKEV